MQFLHESAQSNFKLFFAFVIQGRRSQKKESVYRIKECAC